MTKRYCYDKTPRAWHLSLLPYIRFITESLQQIAKTMKNRSTRITSKLTNLKHLSADHVSSLLERKMAFLYVGIKSRQESPDRKNPQKKRWGSTFYRADEKAWVPQAKLLESHSILTE